MAKIPESEIYKYLTEEKNISHKHAIGMMTNIAAESNFDNSIYEIGAEPDTAGVGFFQYTFPARRKEFIKKVPNWETDWKAQIDFALSESETKSYLNKEFDTEADAVKDFTLNWERPANKEQKAKERAEVYLPQLQADLGNSYSPIDPTGDNIAAALGKPTSEDINADLFGGFESAEAQQAAADAYYANTNQADIINNITPQAPAGFQPQGTPEDEARWYAENTNQDGIINQLANDFAFQSQAANQQGASYEPTAEDYARLGINSNNVGRQVANDYDASQEIPPQGASPDFGGFDSAEEQAAAEKAWYEKRNQEGILREIANDSLNIPEGDGDIPESDFLDPRYFENQDLINPNFVGPPEMSGRALSKGNLDNPDYRISEGEIPEEIEPDVPDGDYSTEDPADRNLLSKLKGQDYMGLLSDIGGYAARMAPLSRALRDAGSYDEERYPRFAPIIPTATLPKRDVRDAFATAQQTALQQGKLDLGALSALATQQAKETARVEENVANEKVGLLNQAQLTNNQLTMQEMADTSANKGAAATMKYQVLAAMSQMGQGSLRESNMRRNDANVKEMFENVFNEKMEDYNINQA